MKRIFRQFVVETVSLYLISQLAKGLVFEFGNETLLLTGLALTVATILVKPIINLLILPINLITFGFFKWVSSSVTLYIVTLVVFGFKINNFFLPSYDLNYFVTPEVSFSGVAAYIAHSFLLSIIASLAYQVVFEFCRSKSFLYNQTQ